MEKTLSLAGTYCDFWYECTSCNTFVNSYIPQPHQEAVHRDSHTYIGNFGGYGSGKTLVSRQEVVKHAILTPNANILIGAKIVPQYDQTIKRELEADLPAAFVKHVSVQKSYIDLINGARIMYRPLYEAEILRSLNLTMFVMVEASEVDGEIFHQLKTRLRNMAASVPYLTKDGKPSITIERGIPTPSIKAEWRKGIVESNPDAGWIRSDVLFVSERIHYHGLVKDAYKVDPAQMDTATASHIADTSCNKYLPKNFVAENTKNKPSWWVARYIFSSFTYAEGLVYPSAMECIVPSFPVQPEWRRLCAFDYGLQDEAVFLWLAIDPDEGIVYAYQEARATDRNVHELAEIFKEGSKGIPTGGWYSQPLIDPKSGVKRDYNKKSLINLFIEEGIYFKPGYINVDARIFRTNTYLESGRLKIMDSCVMLKQELQEYKFAPRSLTGPATDKPVDKNNHGINALEWLCMELPSNPKQLTLSAYDKFGRDLSKMPTAQDRVMPYALQDAQPMQDARYAPYQIDMYSEGFRW